MLNVRCKLRENRPNRTKIRNSSRMKVDFDLIRLATVRVRVMVSVRVSRIRVRVRVRLWFRSSGISF